MINQALGPTTAVAILNELVTCDPVAMHALVEQRVPCNQALENHPTAQVGEHEGQVRIGLLGVLNALFGALDAKAGKFAGWGIIAAEYDDDGTLVKFKLLVEP